MLESTAHTVLAAYRAYAETYLSIECAEECRKRLSPSVRILIKTLEVFLQRKSYRLDVYAASNLESESNIEYIAPVKGEDVIS